MRTRSAIAVFTTGLALFSAGTGMAQTKGDLVVRNATVLTVTDGVLENADVLVTDGIINAIGPDLSAPDGTYEIDAEGMFVMPGIIDPHSHIGLTDVNEITNPVTSEVNVGDVIDPYDISIYRALAGGVTASLALHGSANAIGGESVALKHRWGEMNPEKLKMEGAPRILKMALGENPTRVHGDGNGVLPRTRMGVEQVIRKAFADAAEYDAEWKTFNAAKKQKDNREIAPAYSRRLEVLAGVLNGEIHVHCHAYRADEMLMLLEVFKDLEIGNLTFIHANEGFKLAPEIAEAGAAATVFADWWAYKFEVYYSTAYNAAILLRNGVATSLNSDSAEYIRHLYLEAAKTQKYGGLTDDEALALITINAARQMGVGDRIGSIEVGKDGDLAIFSTHPLSIYAVPMVTIVDGVVRFDRENDPDDQRLLIDPDRAVEEVYLYRHEEQMGGLDDVDLYFEWED